MSLRLLARQTAGEVPYRLGRRRPALNSLSVLMYHAVTRENLQDPEQQSVSARIFAEQMETLRNLGVRWVSLEDGLRCLEEKTDGGAMVSVVFDDGYVGVHDFALEIIARHRIPATLFLSTGEVGQSSFPESSPRLGRPLTWAEIETLTRETGCVVGSHGHNHRLFTRLSPDEIRRELKTSRAAIEDHLHQPCRLFAYPYGGPGAFDERTRRILSEEGISAACTALWGRCRAGTDPLGVPRLRVSWCDTPREITKSLAGCYDWYRFFQRFVL